VPPLGGLMTASSFQSFPEMFLHRVNSTPDSDAFLYPDADDNWQTMTWQDVGDQVRDLAGGLLAQGMTLETRCAILCSTRVDWLLVDLAILAAGCATTTIYPSNTASECEYILNDSSTRLVFVEDQEQLDKLLEVRDQLSDLTRVIMIEGTGTADGWAISLQDLATQGREFHEANPAAYEEVIASVQPEHLATLIYTSGTTGRSKGVELTHDCWLFEAEGMERLGFMTPADTQYLWLPMAHSFGKVLEAMIVQLGIPTAIDGRIDRIVPNLSVIRPTFVAAVPRIFEKVYNKVVTGARDGGKLKWRIFQWSLAVGRQVSQLKQAGQEPRGLLALKYGIADRLVFSKLKALFGGQMRFFISGSAPLSREIAEFFHAADILILEGYGLTETSAASYVNRLEQYRFGTVGVPFHGVEIQIAPEDGEILLRGRGVMRGYHNMPEVTADTLTEDGWLRTGDIGEIDSDGFLKITDRKKDLIKTSGGKYIAPQDLENRLKLLNTKISQVVVHGNRRNFCTALITLDEEAGQKWANEQERAHLSYEQLSRAPELIAEIQTAVDTLNKDLASYETIKKFALLPADFAIETGELTPSMKVKRKAVEAKNMHILDSFYEGALQQL
jgi:long-chain acyl-CoA synthetase